MPYAWAQAAGFVAEFCALGGRIVDRIWIPLGIDPATVATQVPRDVDGVYVGQAILPMAAFLKRYASLGHDLSRQALATAGVVADPSVVPRRKGVVVAGSPASRADAAGAGLRPRVRKGFSRHSGAGGADRYLARLRRRRPGRCSRR